MGAEKLPYRVGVSAVGALALLFAAGIAIPAAGQTNAGTVQAGSSATAPVTVTLSAAGTVAKIKVLTQGAPALDFADAGGDGCAVGTAYAAGATCTVQVRFAPLYAGLRMGAVVLTNESGNALGTAFVMGTGLAGQLGFLPGSLPGILSGCGVYGIATDSLGNAYVTCPQSSAAYKETPTGGGNYATTQIAFGLGTPDGLYEPTGIAVDGAGNVYVADATQNRVVMETPVNGGYKQVDLPISGLNQPLAIAVDAAGNLYIADYMRARAVEEMPNGSGYTEHVLATNLRSPTGIAVDPAGNVFVTTPDAQLVYEIPLGATSAQVFDDKFQVPIGIAADGMGNLYISDSNSTYKETLSGGSYSKIALLPAPQYTGAAMVAVDAAGDIIVGDQVYLLTQAFTSSGGYLSLGKQLDTFTEYGLFNTGNEPVNLSTVTYPEDFPEGPPEPNDIYLPPGVTVTGQCAAGMSLPVGEICLASITYDPHPPITGTGHLAENVLIASDARGGAGAPVSIPLIGDISRPMTQMLLQVSANPVVVGQPIQLTATVFSAIAETPTGNVALYRAYENQSAPTLVETLPVTDLHTDAPSGHAVFALTGKTAGTSYYFADYLGDSQNDAAWSQIAGVTVVASAALTVGNGDAGRVKVGASSAGVPVTVTFADAETLGAIAVLTQGAPNLDFTDAGGGTCQAGQSYAPGASCTVNVVFKPTAPGPRHGAVVLADASGKTLGNGYLQGTGVAAQAAFLPGTATTLPGITIQSGGMATDGSGNIYVASGQLYKLTLANGRYRQSQINFPFINAQAVAVDGSGNIYVADAGATTFESDSGGTLYKVTPTKGGYTRSTLGSDFFQPAAVAVDGAGNVYAGGVDSNRTPLLFKFAPSQGSYQQSSIAVPYTLYGLAALAVDGAGNIYTASGGGVSALLKGTPSGGSFSWAGIGASFYGPVAGLAVDAAGNVYAADDDFNGSGINAGAIAKETPQPDGTYATSYVVTSEPAPVGLTLDSKGNLFVSGYHGVTRLDLADPPALSFADTAPGSTSSDSPKTVKLTNAGNASMTLTAVTYPADFPEAAGTTGDCKAVVLASNASCNLTIDFTPQAAGAAGSSLALAENVGLKASGWSAEMNISVSGTEVIPGNPSFAVTGTSISVNPGAVVGNTSTVTLTPSNGFAGAVTLTAAVTKQPAGAQDLPTFTFGSTSPATISGTSAAIAELTIRTTAPTTGAVLPLARPGSHWLATGGAALACLVMAWIPRRRTWKRLLSALVLLLALSIGVQACGGGGSGSGGGGGGNPGTTPGTYTVTVTGTAGSLTETGTVTLTVQ